MKKILITLAAALSLNVVNAQGPGLVISEFMANPAGTDSPFEYVELVATRTIDFSTTPYSIVFTNNGTATTQGWIEGLGVTYGFDITSGVVNSGDVVYVGGSTMASTGTKLRIIHTGTTNGDGFGVFNSSGVLGNGGGNCDGLAVFSSLTTTLTNQTVPVDAIFFGTGTGSAVVSSGTAGYQLPYNDLYPGGKLQASSFLAPDPASGQAIVGTGIFNTTTGAFTTTRTWSVAAATDLTTAITFSTAASNVSFSVAANNQTIQETTPSATFTVNVSGANSAQAIVQVTASVWSTATASVDYTIGNATIVVPAGSTTAQTVTINMMDDVLDESTEYVVFSLTPLTNATVTGANIHALYMKDDDRTAPAASNQVMFQLLSSYSNGVEGSNSAEIVAHDPTTQRLYVANSIGAKLDILDFSNPASIIPIASIPMTPTYGNINSVHVYNGLVACAVESTVSPQDSGKVVFFDQNGTFISSVKVGAMPDMITFNHTGNKVVVVCEGEPNTTYTNDPEGRVCVIDISGGAAGLTQSNVSFINFTAYIGQENTLRAMGIRIYGPGSNAAQDFEPEYVTISDDDQIAWVTLQENNAIVQIDLNTNSIVQLMPLGYKDHSLVGNGLDASDQTAGINIANFPVKGMYLPDAITHITIGGVEYVLTANEGDTRAYSALNEESRISALTLDPTAFPNASQLKSNVVAGRLLASNKMGDTDNDGDIDEIYTVGARSFTIRNASTGAIVYDSGDDFEKIIESDPTFAAMFNASNTSGASVPKNRSDDKGTEPEGVAVAVIDGNHYAFTSSERLGGVFIYNINNPASPVYCGYYNNRTFATNGPDRGAEGIVYIDASNSPNGNPILLLANEISSTLSVFQVNTCKAVSGVTFNASNTTSICENDSTLIYTPDNSNVNYQWYENGSVLTGETDSSLLVATAGYYTLSFTNTSAMCSDTSGIAITVNNLPVVTALVSADTVCAGESAVFTGSGADVFVWNNGVTDAIAFIPASTNQYIVTGTDINGCENTDTIAVVVNNLPTVNANATDTALCSGESTTLSGSGTATTYTWNNGVTDGAGFTPVATLLYIVTGMDANNCTSTDTISIVVNALPSVGITATDVTVCDGDATTLSGTGADTYSWDNGVSDGISFSPTGTQTYTVTGTDVNGCENTSSVTVVVNSLPTPVVTFSGGDLSTATYTSMQWYLNGNPISGATNAVYTPLTNGNYTVEVTDPNGCTGISAPYTVNAVGLGEFLAENVKAYPNPFTASVTIEVPGNQKMHVTVLNAYGQKIYEQDDFSGGTIDLSFAEAGMYVLQLQNQASQTALLTLVKTH